MICSADAFVCDLVDTKYDAASGCQTLATQLGERWTWIIASVTYCFASVVLLFAIEQTQIGLYLFVTLVISLACRKFDARYVVDLRLLLVLLLAWAECLFWIGVL
jgi:4-hydroxybenzoate polyprenyltransferase